MLGGDAVHMVPEVLRGEPGQVGRKQVGERRLAIPIGKLKLAGGGHHPINGRQQQILTNREALLSLGREEGIQQGNHLQALGDVEQCGHVGEGGDFGFQSLGKLAGGLGGGDEVFEFAQIDLADNLGLAADALAVAGVVIGVAVDGFGG